MPATILDTWAETWVDLDNYSLLHPEPFAQLWRALNTKRLTMEKTVFIPFSIGGIFTLAALGFPDGTNPAHLKANQTRANGAVDLTFLLARVRSFLLIPVVISGKAYQWATGTPSSYTIVPSVDDVLFNLPTFIMAEWELCIGFIRAFLDKLDLLVEIPSVGVELTYTMNQKEWRMPYILREIMEPALKIIGSSWPLSSGALRLPIRSEYAFTSATGTYDKPQKFIDNRSLPPVLKDPVTCYSRFVQPTSNRNRYELGPGLNLGSFNPVEWYSYSTDLAWQVFGSFDDYSRIVPRGTETSYEGDVLVFDSPTQSVQITETTTLPIPLIERRRFTGDYTTDGGAIVSNQTTTGVVSYANPYIGVCSKFQNRTTTTSFSGYLGGNVTSYTIDPGCPVSVSVSLGAFDIINNRTPVTITTGEWTDPPYIASVTNAVPERTLTINVIKLESPVNTFVAYSYLFGTQIYKYMFSSTSTSTHVIVGPAYNYYQWATIADQSYGVRFS